MTLFENSEAVYQADEQSLRICGLLGRQELQRALNKDLTEAHRIFKLSVHNGIKVVSYTDEYYPPSLRKIADPPLVLYVKGTLPSQTSLQVAIVGTREPSRIGRQAAFTFANTLTKQKALVVSGGAVGVDTQAHYGALQAGGTTLCVLGHGILHSYLNGNGTLREEIARHGALISEYPPDSGVQRFSFVNRNRLIAGLTDCTLVVEAGANSGAMITAACAAEQNKPLFALPGSVDNPKAVGTNNLLRMGAVMALQPADLIEWYETGLRTATSIGQKVSGEEINNSRKLSEPMPLVYINRSLGNFVPTANLSELVEDTPVPYQRPAKPILPDLSVPQRPDDVPTWRKELTDGELFRPDNEGTQSVSPVLTSDAAECVPLSLTDETAAIAAPSASAETVDSVPSSVSAGTAESVILSMTRETAASVLPLLTDEETKSAASSVSHEAEERVLPPSVMSEIETSESTPVESSASVTTEKPFISLEGGVSLSGDILPQTSAEESAAAKKISDNRLTEGALSVYDTISESPTDVQEMQAASGMRIQQVLAAVTELELCGLIRPVSFGKYMRI